MESSLPPCITCTTTTIRSLTGDCLMICVMDPSEHNAKSEQHKFAKCRFSSDICAFLQMKYRLGYIARAVQINMLCGVNVYDMQMWHRVAIEICNCGQQTLAFRNDWLKAIVKQTNWDNCRATQMNWRFYIERARRQQFDANKVLSVGRAHLRRITWIVFARCIDSHQ